ncbi:MAG: YqjD family protein [Rhodothalassiaceae bacterium]
MANRDHSAEIDALKTDLAALRSDIGLLTESLADDAGERVSLAAKRARLQAEGLGRNLHHSAEEAQNRLAHEVHANPMISLLTAAGIGFVIGTLSRR